MADTIRLHHGLHHGLHRPALHKPLGEMLLRYAKSLFGAVTRNVADATFTQTRVFEVQHTADPFGTMFQ